MFFWKSPYSQSTSNVSCMCVFILFLLCFFAFQCLSVQTQLQYLQLFLKGNIKSECSSIYEHRVTSWIFSVKVDRKTSYKWELDKAIRSFCAVCSFIAVAVFKRVVKFLMCLQKNPSKLSLTNIFKFLRNCNKTPTCCCAHGVLDNSGRNGDLRAGSFIFRTRVFVFLEI